MTNELCLSCPGQVPEESTHLENGYLAWTAHRKPLIPSLAHNIVNKNPTALMHLPPPITQDHTDIRLWEVKRDPHHPYVGLSQLMGLNPLGVYHMGST